MVGGFAFKHEVNRQDDAGDDVKKLARPVAYRQQHVGGKICGEILQSGIEGGDIHVLHERDVAYAR